MAKLLLDFFFPRKCLGCKKQGNYFCSYCLNRLFLKNEPICPVCSRPTLRGRTHRQCLSVQTLDGLTCVFAYQGLIKKAINKLKNKFVTDLAQDLTEALLSFCGENKAFVKFCQEKPVFVPIPLHPRKKRWRGFNQAELLGEMIAANFNLFFAPNLLVKTKTTKQGAFKASQPLTGQKLILFDDFWVTGKTLKEAAKALKKAGAKKVWGLTLAR